MKTNEIIWVVVIIDEEGVAFTPTYFKYEKSAKRFAKDTKNDPAFEGCKVRIESHYLHIY